VRAAGKRTIARPQAQRAVVGRLVVKACVVRKLGHQALQI
jgi:hypothetical protein